MRTLTTAAPSDVPVVDRDLYDEAARDDSAALFEEIRESGPVVWLPRNRMFAMGRFADVKAGLRDDGAFRSGRGVAANPVTNLAARDTTLMSDDETHKRRRRVLMDSLGAKPLAGIDEVLAREAERLVAELGDGRWFEAASDFSSRLPLAVVADLVGLDQTSDRLLQWAAASFDALGPFNRRGFRCMSVSISLLVYSQLLKRERVRPGTWAASVFDARDRGDVSSREAKSLIIDFVAPALDTTILATTFMLDLLSSNPEAWERIAAEPSLIPAAVVESVRLASPIRGFTRHVPAETEVDGVAIPAGSRVVMLFGAANLDPRQFPEPERFDLDRAAGGHLGWGNGPHTCVGIHLAKKEMQALLAAMGPVVSGVETAEPQRLQNNTLQGIARMRARLVS